MKQDIKKVVGVAFVQDGRLLIVQSLRSSKTSSWTFVGGGVEEGETNIEAAIREVSEEIHNGFYIEEKDLTSVMVFQDKAASDPNLLIEMEIFFCSKKIDVELIPNEEILHYHWYKMGEEGYNVSSSIKVHFGPFALEKGIMY